MRAARCGRRFGLAWYAMEVTAAGGPRHDLAGFGTKRALATPRQADLMIVAGQVSQKMTPLLRQIYDQMGKPKWVVSMEVCASTGGTWNRLTCTRTGHSAGRSST